MTPEKLREILSSQEELEKLFISGRAYLDTIGKKGDVYAALEYGLILAGMPCFKGFYLSMATIKKDNTFFFFHENEEWRFRLFFVAEDLSLHMLLPLGYARSSVPMYFR